MRFVRLYHEGAHGMTARIAIQHAFAATMQASTSVGALHISYPRDPNGEYWLAFENHGHATAFLDIIGTLNVNFLPQQTKPGGVLFGRISTETKWVVFLPQSSV